MFQSSCLAATVSFSYIWLCLPCLGLKFHIIFILWVWVVLQICRSDFIVDKDKMPGPLVLQTVLRNLVAIHLPNLDRCKVGLDIVWDRGWSGYCSRSDLNVFKDRSSCSRFRPSPPSSGIVCREQESQTPTCPPLPPSPPPPWLKGCLWRSACGNFRRCALSPLHHRCGTAAVISRALGETTEQNSADEFSRRPTLGAAARRGFPALELFFKTASCCCFLSKCSALSPSTSCSEVANCHFFGLPGNNSRAGPLRRPPSLELQVHKIARLSGCVGLEADPPSDNVWFYKRKVN